MGATLYHPIPGRAATGFWLLLFRYTKSYCIYSILQAPFKQMRLSLCVAILPSYLAVVLAFLIASPLRSQQPAPQETPTASVMLPHMKGDIEPGKNYIYCPTFNLVWQELREFFDDQPIALDGRPAMADYLNDYSYERSDCPAGTAQVKSFLVQHGTPTLAEIKKALGSFSRKAIESLPSTVRDGDFLALSELNVALRYRKPFYKFPIPLKLKSPGGSYQSLNNFGHDTGNIKSPVLVPSYTNPDEFILVMKAYRHVKKPPSPTPLQVVMDEVILIEEEPPPVEEQAFDEGGDPIVLDNEIIIAMVPPQKTLEETWRKVSEAIAGSTNPSKVKDQNLLRIPIIDFNEERIYRELEKEILNPRPAELGNSPLPYLIARAGQWIQFRLDEKGATLRSGASASVILGSRHVAGRPELIIWPVYEPPPRKYIVDQPFLLALRKNSEESLKSSEPYLVVWVENDDLMEKYEFKEGEIDYFEVGRQEALKNIQAGKLIRKVPESQESFTDVTRIFTYEEVLGTTTEEVTAPEDRLQRIALCDGNNAATFAHLEKTHQPPIEHWIEEDVQRRCMAPHIAIADWLYTRQNADGSWGSDPAHQPLLSALGVIACSTMPNKNKEAIGSGMRYLKSIKTNSFQNKDVYDLLAVALLLAGDEKDIPVTDIERLLTRNREPSLWKFIGLHRASTCQGLKDFTSRTIESYQPVVEKSSDPYLGPFYRGLLLGPDPVDMYPSLLLPDTLAEPGAWNMNDILYRATAHNLAGKTTTRKFYDPLWKAVHRYRIRDGWVDLPLSAHPLDMKADDHRLYANLLIHAALHASAGTLWEEIMYARLEAEKTTRPTP